MMIGNQEGLTAGDLAALSEIQSAFSRKPSSQTPRPA
jgi:hypothetical protein